MIIQPKSEIVNYLLFEKQSRLLRSQYRGKIKLKTPNLSEDASESLACHLIQDGHILQGCFGSIVLIERLGRRGKDILINKYHKLEVKGTSCINACVTTSQSNFEAFAWVWLDFKPFFIKDSYIIDVHVIENPLMCITSERRVETLNENKLALTDVINDAKRWDNYEYFAFNLKTMLTLEDISKRWFS